MTDAEKRFAASKFVEFWRGKGYEKGESQPFWLSLLRDVYGVAEPEKHISFEDQVKIDKNNGFIDGYVSTTHTMIEQKSVDKDLNKPIKQADGSLLTPFQQAKRYSAELPYSQRPRWIVTSNFKEFHIYDMEQPNATPEVLKLEDLPEEYYRMDFLVESDTVIHLKKELEISIKAGEVVGLLYDKLLERYENPEDPETLKQLNVLCVRLVFCLYAEDAGVFGKRSMFHDYLARYAADELREALLRLFEVLDTDYPKRSKYLSPVLAAFPYVNGGLFHDSEIEIPLFTDELRDILLMKASYGFDWSKISPTIFGAVFESTLNPVTRRSGGMHYTSVQNIHKVIDPLFLDNLRDELNEIKQIQVLKEKEKKLRAYQSKLASLDFLDPACGSGNFLTETYICLRRLENDVIEELHRGQVTMDAVTNPIQVQISQFHGIEINDFAVTVAKTALWIAESQMMKETEKILIMDLDFLPLKTNANIVEANALRIDWEDVVPKAKLDYIMGNPPFVGATMMTSTQKDEAVAIFGKIKLSNSIDYVGAWYYKAAELMQGTTIRTAFVSTNSITQGEQVAPMWRTLLEKYNVNIIFAYKTFIWSSEAKDKAAVHCVIIGFITTEFNGQKSIISNGIGKSASNINPYLIDAPNVLIENRSKPICDVPSMILGNKPSDGGNLILTTEEKDAILAREPEIEKYIRKYIGAVEFINRKERYCLWLQKATLSDLRSSNTIKERIAAVKEMRENSTAAPTRAKATTPHLFFFISQPDTEYLLVPSTSSVNRRYIPIGFMTPDIIASNAATIVPNATLYNFGVITSNVHMAWMRTVGGRLKSDYRYSNGIVYNNFPWPSPTEAQRAKIEQTAQEILNARALNPDVSLADLYDEVTMPSELRKAHQRNDRAVMEAYGFWGRLNTEPECVAELMKMYQELTK